MAKKQKPFELTVEYVELPGAQERLNQAYAIILAAGRRHRRELREAAKVEEERRGQAGRRDDQAANGAGTVD